MPNGEIESQLRNEVLGAQTLLAEAQDRYMANPTVENLENWSATLTAYNNAVQNYLDRPSD